MPVPSLDAKRGVLDFGLATKPCKTRIATETEKELQLFFVNVAEAQF